MINNALDDLIKCKIYISNPTEAFEVSNNILLVVEPPTNPASDKSTDKVITIESATDLLDYGYVETESAYIAAKVAFDQYPSPSEIYVTVRTKTEGAWTPIKTVLDNAAIEVGYYCIHLTSFRTSEDVLATAAYAEANEKIFVVEYTDYDSFPFEESVDLSNYPRTLVMFSGNADGYDADSQPVKNEYAALALAAKCLCYTSGSETWHLKELADIVPSYLTDTQKTALDAKNVTTVLRYANVICSVGGKTVGDEWIDVIRFRDWLKVTMQTNVFNVLQKNTKVPFNDAGIGLIAGAMQAALMLGQENGGITADEYDADGNITPAFTISVPKAADLTEAERKSRKLSNCRYTAKLAGAIHLVEIEGYLSF